MFSEVPPDIWDEFFLIRFYFNCTAEGVPELVAYLTSTLNRYQVPYRMKALTDPSQYYTDGFDGALLRPALLPDRCPHH